jgi:hypothetical protein
MHPAMSPGGDIFLDKIVDGNGPIGSLLRFRSSSGHDLRVPGVEVRRLQNNVLVVEIRVRFRMR